MADLRLIVAEHRAGELLCALQAAVNGDPCWRRNGAQLLTEINNHILPPGTTAAIEALRAADARKRAAEIQRDIWND